MMHFYLFNYVLPNNNDDFPINYNLKYRENILRSLVQQITTVRSGTLVNDLTTNET